MNSSISTLKKIIAYLEICKKENRFISASELSIKTKVHYHSTCACLNFLDEISLLEIQSTNKHAWVKLGVNYHPNKNNNT